MLGEEIVIRIRIKLIAQPLFWFTFSLWFLSIAICQCIKFIPFSNCKLDYLRKYGAHMEDILHWVPWGVGNIMALMCESVCLCLSMTLVSGLLGTKYWLGSVTLMVAGSCLFFSTKSTEATEHLDVNVQTILSCGTEVLPCVGIRER